MAIGLATVLLAGAVVAVVVGGESSLFFPVAKEDAEDDIAGRVQTEGNGITLMAATAGDDAMQRATAAVSADGASANRASADADSAALPDGDPAPPPGHPAPAADAGQASSTLTKDAVDVVKLPPQPVHADPVQAEPARPEPLEAEAVPAEAAPPAPVQAEPDQAGPFQVTELPPAGAAGAPPADAAIAPPGEAVVAGDAPPPDQGHDATPVPADPEAAAAIEKALALSARDRREVQQRLRLAEHDPRMVDGIFGPDTRAAIAEWQAAAGLPVTGFLDEPAMAMLVEQTGDEYRAWQAAERDRLRRESERDAVLSSSVPVGRPAAPEAKVAEGCRRTEQGVIAYGESINCDAQGVRENFAKDLRNLGRGLDQLLR